MLLSLRSNSQTQRYTQKDNGPCISCFHHMIKTYTWWKLSSIIAVVRLILKDN